MSFLKNKWVLITAAVVAGFLAWKWWQKRRAVAAPATPGAAAAAAGAK